MAATGDSVCACDACGHVACGLVGGEGDLACCGGNMRELTNE